MFKGFYDLTSGMLTQGRYLDVISNNMTNITTPGYKTQQFTYSTFQDMVMSHTGNKDKTNATEIGTESAMTAPSKLYVDYSQGSFDSTGLTLNFAINGDGFFAVETGDTVSYTRSGDFCLDNDGYLCLEGQGRVRGSDGSTIQLMTDKITVDSSGTIYNSSGRTLGQIGVYTFADNSQLTLTDAGLYTSDTQPTVSSDATIQWKALENSNVDLMDQMVQMMSTERAYQSAAQMAKIYDQVMSKISTEVGKV